MADPSVDPNRQSVVQAREPEESLLTPWRKMIRTVNTVSAGAVGLALTESIIYGLFWFLSHVLHTQFPPIVQQIASGTTFVGFLAFVLYYCYEDLTEYGKQLKARNRQLQRKVIVSKQPLSTPQIQAQTSPPVANVNIQVASSDPNIQQLQAGNNTQQSP